MKKQDVLEAIVVVILATIGILCVLWLTTPIAHAQDVVRNGNTFEQVSKNKDDVIQTKYYYVVDGKRYPIFLSNTGKAFIKRISKKTGKEYRQYLPEITKLIRKEYGFQT